MEKKTNKEELQSRREFFKKAAKGALPILGTVMLMSVPTIIKAQEATSCNFSCDFSCSGGCSGCSGACAGGCSGSCYNTCSGGCSGTCLYACGNSCSNSCSVFCVHASY